MRVELLMSGRVMHGCEVAEIRGELSIGRSSACNWAVPKDQIKISSRHAVLFREKDAVVFKDLDSTNGSFLLGQRISRHVLRPGDELHFGDCQLRLVGAATTAAAPAGLPRLRIRSGPLVGQTYVLNKPEVVIGSDASADICIRDPMLSKRHALLSQVEGAWRIKDLGSTNGTTVGGVKVEGGDPRPLGREGQFYLAHHGFVVEAAGAGRKKVLVLSSLVALALLGVAAAVFSSLKAPGAAGSTNPPQAGDGGKTPAALNVDPSNALPDFAALRAAHPAQDKALAALQEAHERWRAALGLLAREDFAAFGTAARDLNLAPADAGDLLRPWRQAREKERMQALALQERAEKLAARQASLGQPIWESPSVVKNLLAADALAQPPSGANDVPEGGDYGLWLGSQTTFKRLFTASGRLVLSPLADSPRPARADTWRELLAESAELEALATACALPDGPLRARLGQLAQHRAQRDAFVANLLVDAAQANDRAGFLEAVLAERLAGDPAPLRVAGKPLQAWILDRFATILEQTGARHQELEAASAEAKAEARQRLIRTGLPGDSLVTGAWLEASRP